MQVGYDADGAATAVKVEHLTVVSTVCCSVQKVIYQTLAVPARTGRNSSSYTQASESHVRCARLNRKIIVIEAIAEI